MRIAAAMSGGVDSSFAAMRLTHEGHEVAGVTAWLWRCDTPTPRESACCGSIEALRRARGAAHALGIEHRVVDLSEEFERHVVAETVRAYASGLTPNPCALCNSRVRFPFLTKAARESGAEALATGHYARLLPGPGGRPSPRLRPAMPSVASAKEGGGVRLFRGRDREHDQSYFLFGVSPDDLAFACFPLGDMTKSEVRERMAEAGHPAAARPSSQDLCFAGAGDVSELVRSRAPDGLVPGDIVHAESGRVLGRHEGLARYTVGQRKGIGVAWTEPLYVIELGADTDTLVVGPGEALLRAEFPVENVTWLAPAPAGLLKCLVQVRYRTRAVPGRVRIEDGGRARVELVRPVRAVAPGQVAVFYAETPEGEEVLGGGWIGRG